MAVTVYTNTYKFSHRTTPRGRGGWAFESRETGEQFWAKSDTYTGAKRQLKAHAKPNTSWNVLP